MQKYEWNSVMGKCSSSSWFVRRCSFSDDRSIIRVLSAGSMIATAAALTTVGGAAAWFAAKWAPGVNATLLNICKSFLAEVPVSARLFLFLPARGDLLQVPRRRREDELLIIQR